MPFSISDFKAQTGPGGDFLKSSKFLVRIPLPKSLRGVNIAGVQTSQQNRILEYYAEKASIPGLSLSTTDYRRQGVGNLEKAAWGAIFNDMDVTFTMDQKSKMWNFFQLWMNAIYNFDVERGTNYEVAYKDDIATTMTVFVYNEVTPLVPTIIVDMFDIYPVSMSEVQLDWGNPDLARLNVRFTYRSWSERSVALPKR